MQQSPIIRSVKCAGASLAVALGLLSGPPRAFSQGCIPARHMALSLGAEGISYLEADHWQATLSYRYLRSEHIFIGESEQTQIEAAGHNTITDIHSFDVGLTYALTKCFSVTLN